MTQPRAQHITSTMERVKIDGMRCRTRMRSSSSGYWDRCQVRIVAEPPGNGEPTIDQVRVAALFTPKGVSRSSRGYRAGIPTEAMRQTRWSFPAQVAINADILRGPTDRDDVDLAVAVEIGAGQVLNPHAPL